MAVLGNTMVDLIDKYKLEDSNGQIVKVIELLAEMNPILDDALMVECNKGTTHMHTVRTGLPSVSWGKLYKGIDQSKSQTAQVEDTTGFVEGLSTVDERLLKLGNEGAIRLSEAQSFLEAMNIEVASKIFFGNTADDPEEFMGLAPRFNDLSAANGKQIIDAGGTGSDNTSVWFITWGDNQCQLLYPKGTQAGVEREDMGSQRVLDGNGAAYYAKEEKFTWHVGLAVRDHRYVSRIANIDRSDMVAGGKIAIYCNRDVLEALDALASNAGAADNFIRLKPMEIEGKEVMTYRGIPLRETDSLDVNEARVV